MNSANKSPPLTAVFRRDRDLSQMCHVLDPHKHKIQAFLQLKISKRFIDDPISFNSGILTPKIENSDLENFNLNYII